MSVAGECSTFFASTSRVTSKSTLYTYLIHLHEPDAFRTKEVVGYSSFEFYTCKTLEGGDKAASGSSGQCQGCSSQGLNGILKCLESYRRSFKLPRMPLECVRAARMSFARENSNLLSFRKTMTRTSPVKRALVSKSIR